MEFGATIISFMFFLASCIYLYWGIYIIRINPKGRINKAFFAISISLCIWSFGYAMTNSALDLETALFWRRFSSIGKMFLFSTVLHFILLLANKDVSVKQRKLFMPVHIPAFINSYIFAFSSTMSSIQYNMMKIDYGWIDKPVNNVWSFLYYFYYALYIVSSLIIIAKWKKQFKSKFITKQANLFFITFITAFIIGTFTDIVASSIFNSMLPQMTPLFVLLPVWAMYHSARYHDVLNIKTYKKEEIIVTTEQQKKIFTNLSIAICIGGILAFVSEYFSDTSDGSGNLKISFIKGGLLIAIGLSIIFIQRIKNESLKETLTTIVLVSSIPIVMFQFLNYSTITVWVFPIIIILSSLLFSKRTLLISATIVAIITQRLVWLARPESYVLVNKYDYILRIMVFIAVFLLGIYINRIYITKVKENKDQIEFQRITSDILFDFLDINQDNFDCKVNNLLEEVGKFFHVDRTYLFTINPDNDTMTYSNEWCNKGVNKEVGTIEEIPLDVFPWWIEELETKGIVYIEDVDEMPKEAREEQEQLHRQEVKSLVSVPVMVNDKIKAFIGIDSVLENKIWSTENIEMLNIMANILSSGFMQIKADKEIEYMAYYDNLTGIPNRFLFKDRVENAISLAERNERLVSIMFIDLDNFKSVNDTMGHDGGDYLLKEVSDRLSKRIRKTDTVARFGGDEFIILLNNIDNHNDISKIADNIMRVFSKPFIIKGQEVFITASGGIATYPIDGEDSESLVKNADTAMYEAKDNGKNQYSLCTPDMKNEVEKNMKLSNDLYRA